MWKKKTWKSTLEEEFLEAPAVNNNLKMVITNQLDFQFIAFQFLTRIHKEEQIAKGRPKEGRILVKKRKLMNKRITSGTLPERRKQKQQQVLHAPSREQS